MRVGLSFAGGLAHFSVLLFYFLFFNEGFGVLFTDSSYVVNSILYF